MEFAPRTTQMTWPGYELTIESDGEFVHSNSPEPNPSWRLVDSNGHGHFYDKGYPTLTWVSEPCTMGHGDDCDAEGHYECSTCGETIHPGTRQPDPVWIAGPSRFTLIARHGGSTTEYRFGSAEFDALNDAIRAAVSSTLADHMTSATIVS